jgi:hypothetical protein
MVTSKAPTDSGRWNLHEAARFHLDERVGYVRDVATTDAGWILVADADPASIHVYDSSGTWLHDIGRQGSGPGEFEDAFLAMLGDTVLVQDRRNSRVNRFLLDGRYLGSIPTACCLTEGIDIASGGRLLVPLPGPPELRKSWLVVATSGVRDTIVVEDLRIRSPSLWIVRVPGGEGFGKIVPLVPAVRTAIDPTGGLVVAWTGEHRFWRSITGTDSQLVFGRSLAVSPTLDPAARVALAQSLAEADAVREEVPVELLREAYDPALLPDHPELFDMFWVDGAGRTWVQRTGPDSGAVRLDLFDSTGVWLDTIELGSGHWPTAPYFRAVDWTERHAVVVVEGEAGPEVIRYRIDQDPPAADSGKLP